MVSHDRFQVIYRAPGLVLHPCSALARDLELLALAAVAAAADQSVALVAVASAVAAVASAVAAVAAAASAVAAVAAVAAAVVASAVVVASVAAVSAVSAVVAVDYSAVASAVAVVVASAAVVADYSAASVAVAAADHSAAVSVAVASDHSAVSVAADHVAASVVAVVAVVSDHSAAFVVAVASDRSVASVADHAVASDHSVAAEQLRALFVLSAEDAGGPPYHAAGNGNSGYATIAAAPRGDSGLPNTDAGRQATVRVREPNRASSYPNLYAVAPIHAPNVPPSGAAHSTATPESTSEAAGSSVRGCAECTAVQPLVAQAPKGRCTRSWRTSNCPGRPSTCRHKRNN